MKRNAANDNDNELMSSRKKLKFGMDTILGSINKHSDNDSEDELKHKVHIHIESPVSTTESSIYSNEHSPVQPSYSFYGAPSNNHQQANLLLQMTAANHPPPHSLWRPNIRPFMGNYLENNGLIIPGNGFYLPSPMSNLFWSLDSQNKTRPRMLRRAVFSDQQRKDLESAFLKQKYINKPERKKLAQRLGLKDSQVKIWFQNRRMKWRNTKQREVFTSTNSINNDKNDCCDCQQKDETLTYCSSATDYNNDRQYFHTDTNSQSKSDINN